MNKKTKITYERLPLTSDFVFKSVFGRYGNEDILKEFLIAVLKENITKVIIRNGELPKDAKDKKLGILDIRAEIDGKYQVDIEMQVEDEGNITERTMYYLGRLYSEQINQKENYKNMKKTIVIAILNFSYYKRAEYHSVAHMKFEVNNNEDERLEDYDGEEQEIVTDKLEYHVIDLKRFKDKKESKGELADWINLILGKEEKIKMIEKKNKEIAKANKVVEEMSQDPETRELYRLIQKGRIEQNTRESNAYEKGEKAGEKKGREEGIREGETTGRKQEKIEIARKLLAMKIPIEQIIEATRLTKEEIEKLI